MEPVCRTLLDRLHREYRATITQVVAGRVQDFWLVEDLVHETLLRAASRHHTLRDPQSEAAWIRTIARRVALSELRRNHPTATPTAVIEAHHAPNGTQDSRTDLVCEIDEIGQRWTTLPDTARQALCLRADGATYETIATEIGSSIPATKSLIFRARQTLGRNAHGPQTPTA